MATTGVSKKSGLKIFCIVTSGLQNIQLDIDIQNICGLEVDIIIIDTYYIFGQPFCKMAVIKVIKMLCVGLMCTKILFIIRTPKHVYLDENIWILSGLGAEILTLIYILAAIL